jgi:hypothetical protein
MEAAGRRAGHIKAALAELTDAENRLALLHQQRKALGWKDGQCWRPRLTLREQRDQYRDPPRIDIEVEIPFGVVQQQLVYAVERARRKVIQLGGSLP